MLKHTYILLILSLLLIACKQTKYVPEGKYLLKKNEVLVTGNKLDKYDLNSIIRQPANYKSIGVKWKLAAYNLIDSSKVAEKRFRKNTKIKEKNRKRLSKQDLINSKRMDKAMRKGKSHYTQKIKPLKDTVKPRMFFREWYKYKIGRPPVVFDSIPYEKTIEQFGAYLRSKGHYYGEVNAFVKYKDNGKCLVTYHLTTGKQFKIDSVYVVSKNPVVTSKYNAYLSKEGVHPLLNKPFDSDKMDNHRYVVAKYLRNESLYGFSSNHISYIVDTNARNMTVKVGVLFGDRPIKSKENRDSIIYVKHEEAIINNVYFHIADTIRYPGSYSGKLKELGLSKYNGQFLRTLDTTYYAKVKLKKSDELDASRMASFMHNGPLYVKPKILESKNYLEMDQKYSDKKLERTYLSMLQLDLFDAVKTEIVELEGLGCVDAHYYFIPTKKQSFGFEPRATNTNGYLGVAATMNYTNRNLFRGAEKLILSISGGFESQPPVFDQTLDGDKIETAARSFNTFEIGPTSQLELPGLFPLKLTNLSKKLRPETIISAAYNFQKRDDFTRGTFQLNYMWKFFAKKTMIFQSGIPAASVIKFVNIEKSDDFKAKLTQLNDLFLLNAYSNQFIWQDWRFTFEYNIKDKENRKGNAQLNFNSTLDPAGNILSLFKKYQDTLANGQRTIFGIGYSQFIRLDNELIVSNPVGKDLSLNFRLGAGVGIPYGNNKTSLPYDYSFFAGGANDNRGWRARALGPGSYKYYADTNRTATQIGDVRLSGSAEFRFPITSTFKAAFFVDAGNVWTMVEDTNRVGAKFSKDWYKEIAVGGGVGIRIDLEYFIIRVDLGIPLMNPALPKGAKWIFQSREPYKEDGEAIFGINYKEYLPKPFIPTLHFGIGYPF